MATCTSGLGTFLDCVVDYLLGSEMEHPPVKILQDASTETDFVEPVCIPSNNVEPSDPFDSIEDEYDLVI